MAMSMEASTSTSSTNEAKILFATDDFYGVAENLLKYDEPVCNENMFFNNSNNKNVDGWKTKKKRNEWNNFVIIQLAGETNINSICIDTTCFIDYHTKYFSVQGGVIPEDLIGNENKQNRKNKLGKSSNTEEYIFMQNMTEKWDYLISLRQLNPGYPSICKKFFKILADKTVTHLRLNIFPDGGIARLRAYGKIFIPKSKEINLISSLYSSYCLVLNDSDIGHPNNIIQPNESINMTDGWGVRKYHLDYEFNAEIIFDQMCKSYAIFKLGYSGIITRVVIDTKHFTGNAPFMVQVQAYSEKRHDVNNWRIIIPYAYIKPGKEQIFTPEFFNEENWNFTATCVKLIIAPDGGISRFRVFGIPN